MAQIGDFFESALTGRGQSDRNSQVARQGTVGKAGVDIVNAALPGTLEQIKYANSLEPARQNNINDALLLGSPGNIQAQATKQIGAINSNLADETRNIGQQFASAGLGTGAAGGAILDANNAATEAKNNVAATVNDPNFLAHLHQMLLGIVSNGQQVPGLSTVGAGANMVNSQPTVPVGNGLGEILGNIAGQWAGGGFQTPGSNK